MERLASITESATTGEGMARHVPADQAITVRGRAVTVAAFERSVTHWALIGSVTAVPIAAALMYAGR